MLGGTCLLSTPTSLYYYIFRVFDSLSDIYHAFKCKVVCHAVLLYDEDLSGYRCLVMVVHGCVFGGMSTYKALAYSYFTIVLYIFRVCYSILDIYHAFRYKVVCHAVLIYDEDLSGYRYLVMVVHGCVFGGMSTCKALTRLLLLHYTTISSEYVIVYWIYIMHSSIK